jgi:hypothetical protein
MAALMTDAGRKLANAGTNVPLPGLIGERYAFAKGLPVIGVFLLYVSRGVIAGTIVGLLRAHVTSALSATIVGALAAFPVCICAYVLKFGALSRWDREPWILSAVGALILGAVGANVFY